MFITLNYFEDAKDEHRAYKPGDTYPREGLEVSESRFKELSTDQNVRGVPLIKWVEDPKAEEPKKPAKRGRKRG